jgi:hypothetical protein
VHAVLDAAGLGWLRLLDNGVVHEHMAPLTGQGAAAVTRSSGLRPDLPSVRAYHLIPAAASKARAVARHMQARGYAPDECIAIGDSREDLGAREAVGTFWLVGNALERDPSLAAALGPRVRAASGAYGAGVYEAVVTTLAEGRLLHVVCVRDRPSESLDELIGEMPALEVGDGYALAQHDCILGLSTGRLGGHDDLWHGSLLPIFNVAPTWQLALQRE